jgi:hypothetical protein
MNPFKKAFTLFSQKLQFIRHASNEAKKDLKWYNVRLKRDAILVDQLIDLLQIQVAELYADACAEDAE